MVSNNNTDPTPAPPLEGRGEATARRTRPHGTPLPSWGGERLPPEELGRMVLPSLQGEGQGWGLKH